MKRSILSSRFFVASLTSFQGARFASSAAAPNDENSPRFRGTPFMFVSAGTNLSHPSKKRSEDAFYAGDRALGVADGVGGWADQGIDAGDYSRALMSRFEDNVNSSVRLTGAAPEPAVALSEAHAAVRLPGSSTACVATVRPDGALRVVNVGDSGLQVWRRKRPLNATVAMPLRIEEAAKLWSAVATAAITTHGFNFPRQLAADAAVSDSVSDGAVTDFKLEGGELLIAATDGIWDNLDENAIRTVLSRFDFEPCHALTRMARSRAAAEREATRVALGISSPSRALSAIPNVVPEDVTDALFSAKRADCHAQLLAISAALSFTAQRVGRDPRAQSPFATAAAKAGLRFDGGKLDDATAVCALVLPNDKFLGEESSWQAAAAA